MQDRSSSPELFYSDDESTVETQKTVTKRNVITEDIHFDNKDWRGTSMSNILLDNNPWNHYTSPINPSRHHTVLFQLPVTLSSPPKPHYSSNACHWDNNHVRMPFSPKNLYPVKDGDGESIKPRWDLIQLVLLRPISSSIQLEEAIFSYNLRHQRLEALHYFCQEVLEEDELQHFFNDLLPQIIQLALQLPELIPSPIPLLKQGKAHAVSLSQLQIASLLANAFLCTFPWRKDMSSYPGVNFNRLFECKASNAPYIIEKIKCLIHYFRRVCANTPVGVVTFERKHYSRTKLPRWDKSESCIANTKLHIASTGTIEDGGLGLLQVDFANCMVGGGVLSWGCVQEEIRFVICPELLVSRLFTEQLGPTEALQISGVECFSKYRGYSDSFEWAGNCKDQTLFDINGRRRTTIIAIDALYYSKPSTQFCPSKMIRELNKAYVGFHVDIDSPGARISAVATGNWGCGAFRGNVHLKALLQIMACTAANRNIVYYTFQDAKLRDAIHGIHTFLSNNKVTVSQLWRYLCRFNEAQIPSRHLYSYIQQAHMDSLSDSQIPKKAEIIKTTSGTFFKSNTDQQKPSATPNTSKKSVISPNTESPPKPMDVDLEEIVISQCSSQNSEIIIEDSQEDKRFKNNYVNSTRLFKPKLKVNERDLKKNHSEIKNFLYDSDEEETSEKTEHVGLLTAADNFLKNTDRPVESQKSDAMSTEDTQIEEMDVCQSKSQEETSKLTSSSNPDSTPLKNNVFKNKDKQTTPASAKKISDYFKILPK